MKGSRPSMADLEEMTEAELENLILARDSNNDARFVLGRLMMESTNDQVAYNENKGLNWIKEASKKGSFEALEYKTYWDIRFERAPNLTKITENLNKIVDTNKSCRACNTLAELNHAQGTSGKENQNPEAQKVAVEKAVLAAKYYMMSAEQEDVIGMHWIGVFYQEGFGVTKDTSKALEFLLKAAERGNCQSMYQLHLIKSGKDGQDDNFKDVEDSYKWLNMGIQNGATFFDEAVKFFKDNFEDLAPIFLKQRKLDIDVNDESKKNDILKLHNAGLTEMKNDFSACLGKDRLYHKPCGFLNDQQIWMLGVNQKYFINSVLHFDHKDFLMAIKIDLGPLLGHTGLWALRQLNNHAKEVKDMELKKKAAVAIELIEKYLESGLDVLKEEKKYNFINKFGPKKYPEKQIKRDSLQHLYSWQHYAPLAWFEQQKREKASTALTVVDGQAQILCNSCQAPEGVAIKHKLCSGCKQVYYCSVECQRYDWKNGHNKKCKELQAQAKPKAKAIKGRK